MMAEVNTHKLYNTVGHDHVTYLADSGAIHELLVVECANGNFFVEAAFEDSLFRSERFISYPFVPESEFVPPRFYESQKEAEGLANEIIERVKTTGEKNQ